VSDGRIRIDQTDITSWPSHRIARMGIARTFQTVHLFAALTVRENLEVAAVGAGLTRRRGREVADTVSREFGLDDMAHMRAGAVAFGLQRRVEVARALAMAPRFLLLDEPAAGLNETECDELLSLLASIRQRTGCGLLVVDHDMRLIMRLCDRIHVLNYGQTIAEGTADEVCADPDVIEAYLGSSQEE